MVRQNFKVFLVVFCVLRLSFLQAQSIYPISENVNALIKRTFMNTGLSAEDYSKSFASSIEGLSNVSDKKCALYVLATYEDANYLFVEATNHYSQCALLETNPAISQTLKLKSSRSSLLAGDAQLAAYILNGIVANATTFDTKVLAEVYLMLIGLSGDDIQANVNRLKVALEDNRYQAHRLTLLFSLYWVTGEESVKNLLVKEFPNSLEMAVVQNKATISPISFWYLMPRREKALDTSEPSTQAPSLEQGFEKARFYQVGFFKNKDYAENLKKELSDKGFLASVKATTKGGETSYQVLVSETQGEIGQSLKNAGYEGYPVFE